MFDLILSAIREKHNVMEVRRRERILISALRNWESGAGECQRGGLLNQIMIERVRKYKLFSIDRVGKMRT